MRWPGGSTGEGDGADLQRWGPGKECALKCFFCFLVVGNGTWVVSEGCEIRDTSLGTWLSLSDEVEGTPVPKPEVKEEPQRLHTPHPTLQEAAGTESLVGKSWEGPSKTEGQGANITVGTEDTVNRTEAGAECGKCRTGQVGVRRKLDLHWGSPGERGNLFL